MAPDGITVLGTVSKSDLTDEGAGLFTFTNNDGSDVQFDVRSVEVVFDAASNSYNFLDAAGAVIASIDMNASNVAFDKDRKSTRLNSSHVRISYAVFCL